MGFECQRGIEHLLHSFLTMCFDRFGNSLRMRRGLFDNAIADFSLAPAEQFIVFGKIRVSEYVSNNQGVLRTPIAFRQVGSTPDFPGTRPQKDESCPFGAARADKYSERRKTSAAF